MCENDGDWAIREKNRVRVRGPNFTKEEQSLLFSCIDTYSEIIDCKQSDASVKQADKQRAWRKVKILFNSNTRGVQRTLENLQACYRNAKSKAKRDHSDVKTILKDTGERDPLVNDLRGSGKNWVEIGTAVKQPIELCVQSYEELQKTENKRKAVIHKAGVDPGSSDDEYQPINKLKKLIEPEIEIDEEEEDPALMKRVKANESFRILAEEKIELVQMQKDILRRDEIHKKKLHELELKIKMKELELIELKIKKESN